MISNVIMLEGSSVDTDIYEEVRRRVQGKKVMVCLDSLHTHEHVLRELRLYAPLVNVGSYIVVFDTTIEYFPQPNNRPWGPGNNPHTAIEAYLAETDLFEVDKAIDAQLQISAAPGGYLKRTKI
jgi:cephalosporin hydroxylase